MANMNSNGVNGQSRRAEVALQNALRKEAKAQEKMATMMRVNKASDDPTAISVSQRFELQSRGSTVAARNTNDGISMVQTASAGLDSALGITQRIRELALESMNETLSDGDRSALDAEVQQLLGDLDRVKSNTRFNGIKVFERAQYDFQVGYQRGDRLTANFKSFSMQEAAQRLNGDWSFTTAGQPSQAPTSNLGRYFQALGVDPASKFSGASGVDSVWSDGAPPLRASQLQIMIDNAGDSTGPSTQAITINNASFEAQNMGNDQFTEGSLTGWTVTGDNYSGAFNPGNGYLDTSTVTGTNVAYLYSDGNKISQTLSETYSAGSSYEFKLDLGDPNSSSEKKGGGGGGAGFTVKLFAGTTEIGSLTGNTGDINGLTEFTLSSSVNNASLNGEALRLEITKTGGEELQVDNVRGTVTTPGSANTENDATWNVYSPNGSGGFTVNTYSASGADWTMQDLINEVNADTATTGWRAQLAPVNTTDAFTYTADSSSLRKLTISGTGSSTINVQKGTDLNGLIDLVNAEFDTTGVRALEENGKVRFVSEADQVTVGYTKDPNGDSPAPFLADGRINQSATDAYQETYVKQVSFYTTIPANEGGSVVSNVGGTRSFESVSLTAPVEGTGSVTITDAPGLGVSSLEQADYTLAVADEFLRDLASRKTYYGSLENSFKSAETVAEMTEDKANTGWETIMRADEAEILVEQAEASMLVQSSASVVSRGSGSRASLVSMLLSQRNNFNSFF